MYWATVRKVDRQKAAEMSSSAAKHDNLKFKQGCIELEFWWDPFLNSTMLTGEVTRYRSGIESSNSTQPAALLLGTGLWHAKTSGPMFLRDFEQSIDSVAASLSHDARGRNGVILPPSGREGSKYPVLFAPVPLPVQSRLDPTRAATMTPPRIQGMNDYLRTAITKFNIEVLWSYSLMAWQRPSAFEADGYHAVEMGADTQADIFLNMRCNAEPPLDHYPFDKTCCNFQPSVYREQQLLILIAAITALSPLFGAMKPQLDDGSGTSSPTVINVLRAAGILAMAVLWCFLSDRTLLTDRVRKVPNQQTFVQLVALVMLGGLLSIRKSRTGSANACTTLIKTVGPDAFLSRDQTDEWKGWMQFLILIYHYTGMSSTLWVYQIVRLLVASFLFMTGYGHTIYFLKTNDLSFNRIISVLVRLNLLSCLLAYLMRTDYDFYYFPALSSFWFLVLYLTIRIRHQPNGVPRLFALKVVISAILVQILVRTPGILELIFQFLKKGCNMKIDVDEFRFRVSLDAYIVYCGMFAAGIYLQLTGILPCSATCLATQIKKVPDAARGSAVIISMVVLPGYFIVTRSFTDKYEYNRWHPMMSPWPVVAFVTLRNANLRIREFHSRLFIWLGRFSLETFILQYHIWLAADTKALLSLGLWSRASVVGIKWSDKLSLCCEFMLVTTLFLWTSSAASHATNVLTTIIVNGQGTGASKLPSSIRRQWGGTNHPSTQFKGGHEGNEDIQAPVSLTHEDMLTDKSSGLGLRVVVILFVMWISNIVPHSPLQGLLIKPDVRRGLRGVPGRSPLVYRDASAADNGPVFL